MWFTAGPTTYDFDIVLTDTPFVSVETAAELEAEDAGAETTVGRVSMTPDQKLLVVALCEGFLRSSYAGAGQIPSSAAAAERLGWTVTKFNRKLDNVCQKLADAGTRGLHGGPGKLASGRKARLVEHALSTRMVTESDLASWTERPPLEGSPIGRRLGSDPGSGPDAGMASPPRMAVQASPSRQIPAIPADQPEPAPDQGCRSRSARRRRLPLGR